VNNGKIVLECPQCHWIFEVKSPNILLSTASVSKPQGDRMEEKVVEVVHICRNPKCKKKFSIYGLPSE
jgi:Zn-finger protein